MNFFELLIEDAYNAQPWKQNWDWFLLNSYFSSSIVLSFVIVERLAVTLNISVRAITIQLSLSV